MGELHLEIIVDRLLREFKVDANVGRPQVAYRETIKKAVSKISTTLKRQTGGRGMFANVVIDLEPMRPGSGFVFDDKVKGGNVPAISFLRWKKASAMRSIAVCLPATRSSISRRR